MSLSVLQYACIPSSIELLCCLLARTIPKRMRFLSAAALASPVPPRLTCSSCQGRQELEFACGCACSLSSRWVLLPAAELLRGTWVD